MWLTKQTNSPYWYARWYDPGDTKRVVSVSTGQTSKRAAEAHGRELEARSIADWKRQQAGGGIGAGAVIEEYWETEARTLKAATTHVFPHLDRIERFLGDRLYCDVTIADVARFADEMATSGKYSDSTINRAISIWRRMHNVAGKKRGYPVKMIDWSQVRRDEPEPIQRDLKEEDLRRLLAALPVEARAIALFALLTGIRKAQVIGLDWDRVDLDAGTVKVYRKHRKRHALHTIELHDGALRLLKARAETRDGERVFDSTNFRHLWDSAIKATGLQGTRFHDLRHTFATLAAKRSPIVVVKELLGHASITTTMRYSHVGSADKRAALATIPMIYDES